MPVTYVRPSDFETTLHCPPAETAIVSWNSRLAEGSISLRVRFSDAYHSAWLPYVKWSARNRQSLSPRDEEVTIETDTLRAAKPFTAIDVRASGRLDALVLATPASAGRPGRDAPPIELAVPIRSQYVAGERGWCSPASLAMLLQFHGYDVDVTTIAAAVYDKAYGGTGNWAFNMAYASWFGLRAFAAYLRDFEHARAFLAHGLPLALSYAWEADELAGAPLERSDGHLAVLCGFNADGDPIINDPAQPAIRTVYPRGELERLWLRHGGSAYVVAPASGSDPAALVNGE